MTRKDYVSTAEILNTHRDSIMALGDDGGEVFQNLVLSFIEMFEADNERFMADKFDDACWGE